MPEDSAFLTPEQLALYAHFDDLCRRRIRNETRRLLSDVDFLREALTDFDQIIAPHIAAMCSPEFNVDAARDLHVAMYNIAYRRALQTVKYPTEDDL